MPSSKFRFTSSQLIAGAVLVTWACAKGNDAVVGDDDAYSPTGGTFGSGARTGSGGSAATGTGGSASPGSGGTQPAAGGSAPFMGSGGSSGAAGATGLTAGSPGSGGRTGSGGGAPMAGRAATSGGTGTGTGGAVGSGGNGTGGDGAGGTPAAGRGSGGAATNGGAMGAAGLPNDPNWKPPDMTATAKIIILYQTQQTAAMSQDVRFQLALENKTDAAYDLSNVTIRYWMSSEPAPTPRIDYASDALKASKTMQFVGNNANSYLLISFTKGGTLAPYVDQNSLNNANIQGAVGTSTSNAHFNQSNDWSYDATATTSATNPMAKSNPKITMYDGDTLIWGCDPSHTCAEADSMPPDAGAGGQANP
ncbi:MAG TPA: cellulose binding domain-containing protein [Polyangiaceae bacterium]|jgi:hypothetical protein|nr:cellulose binding domain-containing protein [Polyangiaceae bacterium]